MYVLRHIIYFDVNTKNNCHIKRFIRYRGQRFVCISIGKFVINYDEESDIPDVEHLYSYLKLLLYPEI